MRACTFAAAALALLASTVHGRGVIIENDFSIQTFMPLLLGLADPNVTVPGVTTVSGNTWAGQSEAYAQRYLQLASESAANSSSNATTNSNYTDIGAYLGALNPLLRAQSFYEAGTGLMGTLAFAGAWSPYNATAEAMGADPSGNEWDAGRVTLQGYAAPSKPLTGALASSQNTSAAAWLISVAAEYRARNESLAIAALGPLTNLALAIKLDPLFATGVDLYYSGGYLNYDLQLLSPGTSADYYNDFNTLFDPEAAAITMRGNWSSLTLVGTVTASVIPSQQVLQSCTSNLPNATLQALSSQNASTPAEFFAQGLLYPEEPGLPVWDEVATAVALYGSEIATNSTKGYVDIGTSPGSWNYGRTFAYPGSQAPAFLKEATIVTAVDEQAFFDRYIAAAQRFIR